MLKLIGIIFISILFFALLMNFSVVWGVVGKIWGVLTPVVLGAVIAFLLNMPLRFWSAEFLKSSRIRPIIRFGKR